MREFGTDKGREGVKNPQWFADVLCTSPPRLHEGPRLGAVVGEAESEGPDGDQPNLLKYDRARLTPSRQINIIVGSVREVDIGLWRAVPSKWVADNIN